MASGRKHWSARLSTLSKRQGLPRAGRRQLRKLLGRAWGLEWRSLGRLARREGRLVLPDDPLTRLIMERARALGHVAQRLRAGQ